MKQKLLELCSSLRSILDDCKNENPDLFGTFPNAYCADASLWLCDYLISKGCNESLIRFHSKDPFLDDIDGNHVWLYYSGFNLVLLLINIMHTDIPSHLLSFQKKTITI